MMRLASPPFRPSRLGLLLLTVTLATACTHSMEIRNHEAFQANARTEQSLRIAVLRDVSDATGLALAEALLTGLLKHPSVERAVFIDQAPADFTPEYRVRLQTHADYDGSGKNYWITFPGFLVFAHAWNGMAYEADVNTQLAVQHATAEMPTTREIETKYDLRHTAFLRGALVSSGWYTPLYGALNLIMGFYMLRYDDNATEPFLREVQRPYGDYVANTVIEMIIDHEREFAKVNPAEDLPQNAPEAASSFVTKPVAEFSP